MKKKINSVISHIIMFLCHVLCKYYDKDLFYIKGTGSHHCKYLIYTEKEETAKRMDKF